MNVDQIVNAVKSLSDEERAELFDKLAVSMGPQAISEIDQEWGEEAERRIDACDAGEMEVEPLEDVIKALRGLDH